MGFVNIRLYWSKWLFGSDNQKPLCLTDSCLVWAFSLGAMSSVWFSSLNCLNQPWHVIHAILSVLCTLQLIQMGHTSSLPVAFNQSFRLLHCSVSVAASVRCVNVSVKGACFPLTWGVSKYYLQNIQVWSHLSFCRILACSTPLFYCALSFWQPSSGSLQYSFWLMVALQCLT